MSKKNNLAPLSEHLPQQINAHILDLLQRPADKTKFESRDNYIHIQKVVGDQVMNVQVTQYPHGQSVTQSSFNNAGIKANLKETVKQMSNSGIKNKDIASLLNIDPSYVSKLKRK